LASIDDVANNLFSAIMTDQVAEDYQWKSGGRKNDNRPGMSKFINVLAIFGGTLRYFMISFRNNVDFVPLVVLNGFAEARNIHKLETCKISSLFQKARKQAGKRYRSTEKGQGPRHAPPDTETPQREEHFLVSLQKGMSAIDLAVMKYRGQP
jgi:hypothetical protein